MRALFQKLHGEFANINVLTAFLGFREKGYATEFFEFTAFDDVEIDIDTVVVGGIPVVLAALARLGISPPPAASVPASLNPFAGRRVWEGTLGEARNAIDAGGQLFIKPHPGDRKLFGGHVVRTYRDLALTASLPGTYPTICSDPVLMLAEYRVFVLRGEIIGCRQYKGDFRRSLDFRVVDAAVAAYADAPSGYGIDFAVLEDGQTVLVEVNEGFSLGCYGLPSLPYSSLIEARWQDFKASHQSRA